MLLKLYQAGQPVLRNKAKTVKLNQLKSKQTQEVIDFMIATLRDAPGVGLAAPQVGESLRIIILEDKAKYHEPVPKEVLADQKRKAFTLKVLVNPELRIIGSDENLFFEGCLSADGYMAVVKRADKVHVKALDRTGQPVEFTAAGWQARIIQHEIDHLNGTLYVDKMISKSFTNLKNFNLKWRKAKQSQIAKSFK